MNTSKETEHTPLQNTVDESVKKTYDDVKKFLVEINEFYDIFDQEIKNIKDHILTKKTSM
jgi:hypothetical protein